MRSDRIVLMMCALVMWSNLNAAMKVIYAGTETRGAVSESMRRGNEFVLADALAANGLRVYDDKHAGKIARAQTYHSDIVGEEKISYWCRRIKAERGLYSVLSYAGGYYNLKVYVINPQTAKAEYAAEVTFKEPAAADEAAQRAAQSVSDYLKTMVKPIPGPDKEGFYLRSVVPGLAQKYYGHERRGLLLQTLFGIGLLSTGASFGYYQYKKEVYENYKGGPRYPGDLQYQEKAERKYDSMKESFDTFKYCSVATCMIWMYNLVDAYSFSFFVRDTAHHNRPWRSAGMEIQDRDFVIYPALRDVNGQSVPVVVVGLKF